MAISRRRRIEKRPRDLRRARAKVGHQVAGPGREYLGLPVPDGVTDAEVSTVDFLAVTFGALPTEPSCSGPVVVHADGAFECRGPGCPGATKVFHSSSAIDPCHTVKGVGAAEDGRHACVRCAADDYDRLGELACPGMEITHDDGRFECSAGEDCLGDRVPHMTARSCRLLGSCDCSS